MNKEKKYQRKPFASAAPDDEYDHELRLYDSMTSSPAWKDLTGNQRALYIICKGEYGKKELYYPHMPGTKRFNDPKIFILSYRRAQKKIRLGAATFYKSMKALVSHGFLLNLGRCGGVNETVYKLSDQWKSWGKEPGDRDE